MHRTLQGPGFFTYTRNCASIQKKCNFPNMGQSRGCTFLLRRPPSSAVRTDEASAVPLSRAENDRRSGADPRRGCGRGRPRAGRRPEPGPDHGVPPGAARAPRRHQRRRGARDVSPSTATSSRSAPACAMPPSTSRSCPARSGCSSPKVVRHIAHYPIRTRGTFCGSIAHADPASEWCLVAAALGAEMVARRAGGTRTIAGAMIFSAGS